MDDRLSEGLIAFGRIEQRFLLHVFQAVVLRPSDDDDDALAQVRRLIRRIGAHGQRYSQTGVLAVAEQLAALPDAELRQQLPELVTELRHAERRPSLAGAVVFISPDADQVACVREQLAHYGRETLHASTASAAADVVGARPVALVLAPLAPWASGGMGLLDGTGVPLIAWSEAPDAQTTPALLGHAVEVFSTSPSPAELVHAALPWIGVDPRMTLQAMFDPITALPDEDHALAAAAEQRTLVRGASERSWCMVGVELDGLTDPQQPRYTRNPLLTLAATRIQAAFPPPATVARGDRLSFWVVTPGDAESLRARFDDLLIDLEESLRTAGGDGKWFFPRAAGVQARRAQPEAALLAACEVMASAIEQRDRFAQIVMLDEPVGRRLALVASDDPATAEALAAAADTIGLDVDITADGLDVLRRLAEYPYAVVVVDLSLALIDGLAVIRNIEHVPEHRRTPLILVCGADRDRHAAAAFAAGAHDVVLKPVRPDVLAVRIGRLLKWADGRHG